MKKAYPVIFSPAEEGGYCVYTPDLDINTQGDDITHAIAMARDAIGLFGIDLEDDGKIIPEPSNYTKPLAATETLSLVDIDFAKYRRMNDMTTMRINVSIPKYLKYLSEQAGLNLSRELQEHLKSKLCQIAFGLFFIA